MPKDETSPNRFPSDFIESNKEIYKREAELAFSIADHIPESLQEQIERSEYRFRDHSTGSHILADSGATSHRHPNHTLHTCLCGWLGWLIPEED